MYKVSKFKMDEKEKLYRAMDDFLQEKLDMNVEDLRVDNPNKKQGVMGFFKILDIEDSEIGLMDLTLEMPFIVKRTKIFDDIDLNVGEIIWAKVYSSPEDGMTKEWFFEEIKKPIKGKRYKSGNY